MREKETATIGCAVVLCGLVSPWCKLATTILVNLYNNKKKMGRGEEGGGEGTKDKWGERKGGV